MEVKAQTARKHPTLKEPQRVESFTELSAKLVGKLQPPKLGKLNTVPMRFEGDQIGYESCNSQVSSKKPPSYYEAYENRKKSKSKRKLMKQTT